MDTTVATVVRFRTALAGFHKTDVTNYISQSARANRDTVNELNQQILALQEENAALRANAMDGAHVAELEQKAAELAELEQENGLLRNRVRQLEYKLEEALAVPAEEPVQEEAVQEEASAENLMELELAAYRRAEEMERRVSQRTRALATQLDGIAQNSTQQFGITVDSARDVLAAIEEQLQILQSASDELKLAMTNSMEQMKAFVALLPEVDEAE